MRVDASGPAIEGLRTFLLLAEGAGVADVAKKLGVDGSAVSRRLRPFQRRLGLLGKRGGSLVLTDRGRELVPTIQAVLKGYDALADQLRHREAGSPAVTIAVGGFGGGWLAAREYARHGLGAAIVPVEALGDGDAGELLVRRLAPPLWPRDHLLHRPADGPRLGALKALLVATAAEQCRRQQGRLDRFSLDEDGDGRHGR